MAVSTVKLNGTTLMTVNDTTAVASDVANGESFYMANGVRTTGTSPTVVDLMYPVGSIYMSVNSANPSTLFGGTWVALEGRFLLGADSTYTVNSTGGEATHTLTVDEMPSHNHTVPRGGNAFGTNVHGYTSTSTLFTSTDNRMSSVGGGQAHNNMPPYLAVYMWKRTA